MIERYRLECVEEEVVKSRSKVTAMKSLHPSISVSKGLLIAFGSIFVVQFAAHAGERVIFSNSNSKIRIPKEELKNNTITPNSEGFNRDHSSVEGVFAPWQNPMNGKSSVKQKERLLKALDRQKNWMLQDPDDILGSKDLSSSEVDFEDTEFSTRESRFGSRSKNSFSRFYNRRGNENRYGKRDDQRRRDYSNRTEGGEDMEKDADERPKDSFATDKYFSAKVNNIFDAPEQPGEGPEGRAQSAAPDERMELPTAEASLSGFVDPFTELGIRPQQAQNQAPASEFEKLLNTTVMDMTAGSQTGVAAGVSPAGVAGRIDFSTTGPANPAVQPAILDGFRQTISGGLGAPSALDGAFTGSAFESAVGGGRSSVFDNARTGPSVTDRPAIFELPTRSF